jgi:hypothetical protein
VDNDTNAIITFQDIRNAGNNDIFAYKISPTGQFLWGENGTELSNSVDFEVTPVCVLDSEGNTIVAWNRSPDTGNEYIMLQKISPSGEKLWGDGIVYQPDTACLYSFPILMNAGNGNVFMIYSKQYGSYMGEKYIYFQKIGPDGILLWQQEKVVYEGTGIPFYPQTYSTDYDENGGFYISWFDDRNADWNYSTFVQHTDNDGNLLMPADGVEMSTDNSRQHLDATVKYNPQSDKLFVFWSEQNANQDNQGLSGQLVTPDGTKLWGDLGKKFIDLSDKQISFVTTKCFENDAVVIYDDYNFGNVTDSRVMCTKVDESGSFVWNPQMVEICSVQSDKVHRYTGILNNYQWIMAWEDQRNGESDIYAQNLQANGLLGPVSVGIQNLPKNVYDLFVSPNPLYNKTEIVFILKETSLVKMEVFSATGTKCKTVFNGNLPAGVQKFNWDGKSDQGSPLSNGTYLGVLSVNGMPCVIKIVIQH